MRNPNPTHYASEPGIVGEERSRPPPHAGRRGPPPKIWRQRCPNWGKRDPQGSLPRQAPSPHHALQRANPPTSRKSIINLKVLYFSWINDQDSTFCSPAGSSSQQGSSSGELPPEMMESETPPASPVLDASDSEVSSRRSPDLQRPEANASAALSPDVLTGLLERAALSEEHRSLMSMVLKKISSATSGLNEAFTSLLRGFEVCNGKLTISLVVRHALGVLHIDSSP